MELHKPDWTTIYNPGTAFYANEILSGIPFSFPRYGEGEWHVVVPDCKIKRPHQYSEWREEEAQNELRNTLLNHHDHERYWMAMWHHEHPPIRDKLEKWTVETGLNEIEWHWGAAWRRGAEQNKLHLIVDAIRQQELPLVIVGPESIKHIEEKLKVAKFVQIHPTHAYYDRDEILQEILDFEEPAFISFSAGGTSNILIHRLFPEIGEMSYMIDFGAMWNGLCGTPQRAYQKRMNKKRLEAAWRTK